MHKRLVAVLALFGAVAWGQNTAAPQTDRASAYYYYTVAHMYADLAGQTGNREYVSKAIDNYKLAMKADPAAPAIGEELSDFYIQTGRAREAQNDAEEALKQNPNDLNALRLLAKIYTGQISSGPQNRLDETMLRRAIEEYQKIVALAPKDIDSWVMLGRLQKIAMNSVESRNAYEKAMALDPDSEDALTGLALVYSDLGDTEKATDLLKKLAATHPSQRSLQALAGSYEQMHQYGPAADALNQVLSLNPPNAGEIKKTMAEYQLRAERYKDALQTYQELVAEDPNDAQSYLRISQIYRQLKDFPKAHEAADKARAIDATNPEVRLNDVFILQAEGKTPDAIQTLKDLLASMQKRNYNAAERQTRAQLLMQLSALYRDADQTELAVDALRQAAEANPERATATTIAIVETYREAHEFAKAQQELDAALKKSPDDRDLHATRATLLADMGKTDQAVSEAKKLLGGKEDREAYLTLASVYDKAKKFDDMGKALDQAEKLAQTGDDRLTITFQRGAMYERMKKVDLAEQQFRKVLEMDPNNAGALNYLGYMLADRNLRLQEALDYITKAVDKEPENGAYIDSLGWIYFRLGRLDDAENQLRRAVQKTPHDPTVHDHLAEALMRQGKVREAMAQWQISLKEWETGAPADLDPAEVSKTKNKLESARVRLAQETAPAKK
ncbi:MAG: tetratricopeptide repeat protein [Bryobacterales bacterium]|nr:tetratricopeptide repeat protein [Bryobacterales bacterium]MBV9401227.1 tetratricopeptide repeat protein [Bryobacterales bacterium]